MVYALALLGHTQEECAKVLGITRPKFRKWRDDNPDLEDAWRRGGDAADSKVARALYKRALGFNKTTEKLFFTATTGRVVRARTTTYFPPDVTACVTWLSVRQAEKWGRKTGFGSPQAHQAAAAAAGAATQTAIAIYVDADTHALATGRPPPVALVAETISGAV